MSKKTIYVAKDLVIHEELSELDFTLMKEFNYNFDGEDDFREIDVMTNKKLRINTYADTTPVSVKDLEKLIAKFKKKGATHIQMLHHPDHIGYEFSGFKITLADDELVDRYKAEHKKKAELNKKYNKLKKEMDAIEREYDKLKI